MERIKYQVTYIRIGTIDLPKARSFYEDILGLSLISSNLKEGYLLFALSGITLIVETTDEQSDVRPGRYLGISLKVQDIFHVYNHLLEQGVAFMHPPEKQYWGGYLTEFQDTDHNTWTLLG